MNAGIVVLNWNGFGETVECLESIDRARLPGVEVLVVDNGSSDGSRALLESRFPKLPLISTGENLGYAGGNNVGIRYWLDRGKDSVVLINNDITVEAGFLAPLFAALDADPELGLVGPLILRQDEPNKIECAGLDVGMMTGLTRLKGLGEVDVGQFDGVRIVEHPMGACLLVRRAVFDRIGLLDESFFMYSEEVEFAQRAAGAGFRSAVVGDSKVLHKSRMSSNQVPGLVLYYGTRNSVLLRRRIASRPQWLVFAALDLLVRFPRRWFGLRRQPRLRSFYMRAVQDGYAGRGGRVELGRLTSKK